jgi:hypothetical protein
MTTTPVLMEAMGMLVELHSRQLEALGGELLLVDQGDFRVRLVPELGYMLEHGERTWPVSYREAFFAVGGEAGAREMFARLVKRIPAWDTSTRQLRAWCEWCAEGAKTAR